MVQEKLFDPHDIPACAATLIGNDGRICVCLAMGGKVREMVIKLGYGGFAPIEEPLDPTAEVVSKHDIGCVVWRDGGALKRVCHQDMWRGTIKI